MTNPYGHDGRPDFVDSDSNSVVNPEFVDPSQVQMEASHRETPEWAARQGEPHQAGQRHSLPQDPSQNNETTQQAEHPKSMLVLILGILGFLLWIPGIIGWAIGGKAKKEIRQGGAPYPWDGALRAGYTLSVISTVIVAAYLLFMVAFAALIAALIQ